jgi:hypothetical protein
MAEIADSRPNLERWPALLIRYWAFGMTLIHDRGSNWPGFRYGDDEKAKLQLLARQVPAIEYYLWLALAVVFFLLILTGVVLLGTECLIHAIGGEQNMAKTPAPVFFLQLALDLGVSLSLGLPAAMLPAAALTGRWFAVADQALPDRTSTAHFVRKLWRQITRAALVILAALLPIWIFVPGDSKFWVIAQVVLPMLSPAVAVVTAAYYVTARGRRDVR